MLETLDYSNTIRIGSTPTFFYFGLFHYIGKDRLILSIIIYTAYASRFVLKFG